MKMHTYKEICPNIYSMVSCLARPSFCSVAGIELPSNSSVQCRVEHQKEFMQARLATRPELNWLVENTRRTRCYMSPKMFLKFVFFRSAHTSWASITIQRQESSGFQASITNHSEQGSSAESVSWPASTVYPSCLLVLLQSEPHLTKNRCI